MYNSFTEKNITFPLIITPQTDDSKLEVWLVHHPDVITQKLGSHKALLFRGFEITDGLKSIAECMFDELLTYSYRSTPRTDQGNSIYSSTEYPKQLTIPQHCEEAYQLSWPMKLLFHCKQPASKGGFTPLADMVRVTQMIDDSVKEEFERKHVKYVRNYRPNIDLPWQNVFNTDSKDEVENFCKKNQMAYEWVDGDLRTSQVCQAMAIHPVSSQKVWFNQAHLFHISSHDAATQEALLYMFKEEELPRNTYFGDDSPIDPAMLDHIRTVFEQNKIKFAWKKDDILLIDNMLVSHGREPFEGERLVSVCMAEPHFSALLTAL